MMTYKSNISRTQTKTIVSFIPSNMHSKIFSLSKIISCLNDSILDPLVSSPPRYCILSTHTPPISFLGFINISCLDNSFERSYKKVMFVLSTLLTISGVARVERVDIPQTSTSDNRQNESQIECQYWLMTK